ncbi:hypothetical protein [Streptomyces sp. NPDC052107]|uniref:hypothetical protein n=1 Tax=Streptomyces sp. NPDC052107 TaxID=3155632 RepID=UPI00343E1BDD
MSPSPALGRRYAVTALALGLLGSLTGGTWSGARPPPGESVTLTATCRTADLHGSALEVRISGWNTPERTVPAA